MSNQFNITCDYPGLCALCHTEIAEFDGSIMIKPGVYYPKITKFKGNMAQMTVTLNDNSKMLVVVCTECEENFDCTQSGKLMESVINGWQHEIDYACNDWIAPKKLAYMDKQSTKIIVDRDDKRWTIRPGDVVSVPESKNLNVKLSEEL